MKITVNHNDYNGNEIVCDINPQIAKFWAEWSGVKFFGSASDKDMKEYYQQVQVSLQKFLDENGKGVFGASDIEMLLLNECEQAIINRK